MTHALIFLLLLPFAAAANAQSDTNLRWRASRLAVSAFQCSLVASEAVEQQRLFDLGVKIGRDFIKFALQPHSNEDKKAMEKEMPMVWGLSWGGPSEDFVLGRVFQMVMEEQVKRQNSEIKALDSDRTLTRMWQLRMYQDGNCALLR